LTASIPTTAESMEFGAVSRKKSLPQPGSERHPFLEGDAPAPRVAVKKHGPASVGMESRERAWRPCVRQMQPVAHNAAGLTNAKRHEIARREMGAQLAAGSAKPPDDRQADDDASAVARGPAFTPNSHLLHTRRVPYGHDDREEEARAHPEEADCFGRAPSPRRRRPPAFDASDSGFAFEGGGTAASSPDGDAASQYRPCKAPGHRYDWVNYSKARASSDPNALIADRPVMKEGAFKRRGAAPSAYAATLVPGAEWGAAVAEADEVDLCGHLGRVDAAKHHDPWGHSEESAGVIAYAHAGGERGDPEGRFVDPRREERATREAAIREATLRRFDDAALAEFDANRGKCVGGNDILRGYLYDNKGKVDAKDTFRPSLPKPPPLDAGEETIHSKFY